MTDHPDRLSAIARFVQREDDELLYTPDGAIPPRVPAHLRLPLGLRAETLREAERRRYEAQSRPQDTAAENAVDLRGLTTALHEIASALRSVSRCGRTG